jgi:glycosyltransferase involved in cell wall biosynthesis/lysophospholipid acyltransferase (LPLAT)-like uncharacterized protein
MNILMMTNTFTPHVGGVARSVEGYTQAFRRLGHRVLVAAPLFKGTPDGEEDVVRFPAVRDFNGSDFSVPVPKPLGLLSSLKAFRPEVVHAHHPFLLGGTALRVASARNLPLIFTHHTLYEQYTHYVPGDSAALKRFAIDLVTGYCNLCDAVIAPSRAVARLLEGRGVRAPLTVIPTGIDTALFAGGDGPAFRRRLGIPARAFVVGHVGRLAPEKNLGFLAESVARFLEARPDACFLLVGGGPAERDIRARLEAAGVADRLYAPGVLARQALAGAYRAMDVFAFASRTETQGMVLCEAMAAGVPVVALDAIGPDDLVEDGVNGRLLSRQDGERYATALAWVADLGVEARLGLSEAARRSARGYDIAGLAEKTLGLYRDLLASLPARRREATPVASAARRLRSEWRLLYNIAKAAGDSMRPDAIWEIGPASAEPGPEVEPASPPPSRKARVLGWVWSMCLRLQCATWRKRYEGLDRLDRVLADGRPVLFCFWHGKYVSLFALLRGRPACVFTTRSARGAVIAEVCRRFGYDCVQVPARSQGQAYELMRRALMRHQNGGIAVDGPLGPYHRVKRGAVKLASELGYLVVPASASARRKRVFRHRWDRLELPGLFTCVGLAVGEPLEVPAGLDAEATQLLAVKLRTALEVLDQRAEALAGVRQVVPRRPAVRPAQKRAADEPI